jgi:hypothetical protein
MSRTAVKIVKGGLAFFESVADSGSVARREFCSSCGTPLFASSTANSGRVGLKAASLDDPRWFSPEADVWVGSAQEWDYLNPAIPKFERGANAK